MKALVPSLTLLSLVAACSGQAESNQLRQGEEFAAEYDAKEEASSDCIEAFEGCIAAADPTDATAMLACGDALTVCLGDALPPVVPGGGSEEGGSEEGGSEEGGSEEGGSDDGEAPAGEGCEAILDGCLSDPLAIDPTCFDDFQTCINDEIETELDGICDQLVAECEANAIPGFDCSALCL